MFRQNRVVFAVLLWAFVIFATSCRFIERSIFINFVKQFIPAGVPQELWVNFWGAFGIFVVKGYHVSEFAFLCWLLQKALGPVLEKNSLKATLLPASMAFLYACSDEWHQTFVHGRGGTWVDVVIDCLGIAIMTLVALRTRKKRTSLAMAG